MSRGTSRGARRNGRQRPTFLVLLLVLGGCNANQLQFRSDHRLTFQTPAARHRVTTPLTVSWRMADDTVGPDGTQAAARSAFAVFVDRAPMPAGKDLKWLARDEAGCSKDPRCPDAELLAERGVYVTEKSSVTLNTLPPTSQGVGDEQHYVTIVLLDSSGHRIGESAWYLPFTSRRRSS